MQLWERVEVLVLRRLDDFFLWVVFLLPFDRAILKGELVLFEDFLVDTDVNLGSVQTFHEVGLPVVGFEVFAPFPHSHDH